MAGKAAVMDGTDKRSDGRTPDRYVDLAPQTVRAASKNNGNCLEMVE